ncbi:uncharacterized protein EI97DRAFT_466667 [Westerdykella ornata]|uniref:alpha-glucosidase n=1 Tax=Westerdykella ornata TaxID=318751 RepID=A0A6A6JMF8_WESOR|nr:uncharacterized protein EI97DRAFT_466667 [Westerdykella ornata]KAF2277138.1 hypothetical protein EI97DRAFT_466667 [Westerdykella ornata]
MLIPLLFLGSGLVTAIPFPQADGASNRVDLSNCPGYAATNIASNDHSVTADLKINGPKCNAHAEDLEELKLLVEYQTGDRLHVKIYDAGLNMYQVQEEVLPRPKHNKVSSTEAALQFNFTANPFSLTVTRKSNNEVLFDTRDFQLIYESQYIRLRTKLPQDPNLYGLGEHSDSFRLATNGYTRSLWNSESPGIPENSNIYGTHPVYFDHRGAKGTHGVFLLNANGMNINIDQDSKGQYLEYNTIGGVLDFYFMAGPQPADVSRQYADIVGYPAMFPYWTLGFHQCKYGYWDVNMVAEVVANYSKAEIPLEVMWTDIDYMHYRRDFTLDPDRFPKDKMRELVATLHSRDQKYILILDPAIAATLSAGEYPTYQRGRDLDVFFRADPSKPEPYLGVQWAGVEAWPDWSNPRTEQWWTNEFDIFFNPTTGIDVDGVWVDMNEASNFCPDIKCNPAELAKNWNIPPEPMNAPRPNTGRPIEGFPPSFQPESTKGKLGARQLIGSDKKGNDLSAQCPRRAAFNTMKGTIGRDVLSPAYKIKMHDVSNLSDRTLPTTLTNCDGTQQYDTHNLHGALMASTTYASMLARRPHLRPFVLTRSTFAGTGTKAAHWFGDNESSWAHYRTSVRQMLAFVSMHQMPMVGSDICGFNGNAQPALCARWAMLGAFQPFYRNHAADNAIAQEFYQWPETVRAARRALDVRYRLLDYAYTAMWYQHKEGTPMVNPLFFLYPHDAQTFAIQEQWFWGDALLVSPVTEGSDAVTFYLPDGVWYDFWTHDRIESVGRWETRVGVGLDDIPVHVRGGSIVPLRVGSGMTTKAVRREGFELLVAPDRNGTARGRLYVDDGESLVQGGVTEVEFVFEEGRLVVRGVLGYRGDGGEGLRLERVVLLGQNGLGEGRVGVFDEGKGEIVVEGPGRWECEWGFTL